MIDLPETGEGSTSIGDNIQLEMVLPNHSTVSSRPIVEPGEPCSDDEEEVLDEGGAHEYNLVRDRASRQIQPLVRYGFEELVAYSLLTSSGDPSTFREVKNSPENDI